MIIRPRLIDHFGVSAAQAETDFAIPFLDEDIPLYLDPFMLWRSPSQQDQSLHLGILNSFNNLGRLWKGGDREKAISTLVTASECDEVGLGNSASRSGKRISRAKAEEILRLFDTVPYYNQYGFRHFEEIQFFIDGVSKDRISDIACNFIKSFLADYTHVQCKKLGIPMQSTDLENVYDQRTNDFTKLPGIELPINPVGGSPMLLVPKRWLRFVPWLSYDDYFHHHCPQDEISHSPEQIQKVEVLTFNHSNYGIVDSYVRAKELSAADCSHDPLFSQIPVTSAKRTWNQIKRLPTGKAGGADAKYERLVGRLLPTLFYPQLDFAAEQARTDSGVSIRDLIFYNTASRPFLDDLLKSYGSRQITFELKNVGEVSRDHIDQLNRYLSPDMGHFGVIVTRKEPVTKIQRRVIDLWSGQRRAIIFLTDADLEMMVTLYESKQREPLDVLVRNYADFKRRCP